MGISGHCCLRISSKKLDFNEINYNIKLQPSKVFHKGEMNTGKYEDTLYKEDCWLYEVEFSGNHDINDILNEFSTKLCKDSNYLKTLYKKYYVRLWCDIYSDLAQLCVVLSPETMQKLSNLGIGLDIQIYSYGDLE